MCQVFFFNNVAALRTATLSKKELWQRCFRVSLAKLFKNTFFTEHLWTTASVNRGSESHSELSQHLK